MYTVTETDYGVLLTVKGEVSQEDARGIQTGLKKIFESREGGVNILADLREMNLLSDETQAVCRDIQVMCGELGMKRAAVVLSDPTVTYQFKRLSLQSGAYDRERYIDASVEDDWQIVAESWVRDGIDPEADRRKIIAQKRTMNLPTTFG